MGWIDLGAITPNTDWQFIDVTGYDYFKLKHIALPINITAYIARIKQYSDGSFEAYDIQPIFGFSDIEVYKVKRTHAHSFYGTAIGIKQKYEASNWQIEVSGMDANDYSIVLEDLRDPSGTFGGGGGSGGGNNTTGDVCMWKFLHEDILINVHAHTCVLAPYDGDVDRVYKIIYQGNFNYQGDTIIQLRINEDTSQSYITRSFIDDNGNFISQVSVSDALRVGRRIDTSSIVLGDMTLAALTGTGRVVNGNFGSHALDGTSNISGHFSGIYLNPTNNIYTLTVDFGASTFTGRLYVGGLSPFQAMVDDQSQSA